MAAPGDPDYVEDYEGLMQISKPASLVQKPMNLNQEPVTTSSGSGAKLNDHIKSELGFEDDGGITADMTLQIDESVFTGMRLKICDGMNGPHCVEPSDAVFVKGPRREGYQPTPGAADDFSAVKEVKYVFPSFL